MNSTTEIHRCQSAFVLQRYFCTFAANPSDSISDVVIQMHFLSLYKGRICVYSTRNDFKHNSYTNSYTKFLFGSRQIFRNLDFFAQNRKSYTNSYTYSDTKLSQKQEKTATEALLLRFFVVPPERHLKKGLQNIIG